MSDNCRGSQIDPLVLEVILANFVLLKCSLQLFDLATFLSVAILAVLLSEFKLVLRGTNSALRLHDLLLGEAHRVAQFLNGLLGVLLSLLVSVQFRQNCADVQNCPRTIALDRPKILKKFNVFCICIHHIVQISALLFVVLKSRLEVQGFLEIYESTLEVLLLLAKAAQVVVGEAHEPVLERVKRANTSSCRKVCIAKVAD